MAEKMGGVTVKVRSDVISGRADAEREVANAQSNGSIEASTCVAAARKMLVSSTWGNTTLRRYSETLPEGKSRLSFQLILARGRAIIDVGTAQNDSLDGSIIAH
jgi:hypothetical protein